MPAVPSLPPIPSAPRRLQSLLLAAATACAGVVPGGAVVIRTYDFTTNVRLAWMPDQHLENPGFPLGQNNLRGIGWPEQSTGEWTRQMTLISPYHFVFATHYTVDSSWQLSFQLPDGTLLNRHIVSTVPVPNASGQNTDVLLGTLDAPITPDTGIVPFAVANLANDAAYLGQRAWVFGKVAEAGRATLVNFATLTADGFNTTRFVYFDYANAGTAGDDCHVESGDSGSPTFIIENGIPSLIGTHSYLKNNSTGYRSYDAFVPDYLPEMDTMMEPLGYHVKRSHPVATTMTATAAASGSFLTGQPASAVITAATGAAADAHNVALSLTFSRPPATLSGNGWICQQQGTSGTWNCRRGGLAKSVSASLTAGWTDPGEDGVLNVSGTLSWDGAASAVPVTTAIAVGPQAYANWAAGLAHSGVSEDPDQDGIVNLLEYAFGGDPAVASRTAIGGHPLLPEMADGVFHFPQRTDAFDRGLVYHIETSTDLATWTETLPDGVTMTQIPYDPPVPGFTDAVVNLLPTEPGRFYRVRVEMTP